MDYENIKQVKFYIDGLYSKYDLELKSLNTNLVESNNQLKKLYDDLNTEIVKYNSKNLLNNTVSNILKIKKQFNGGSNKNINILVIYHPGNFIEQNILNNINNNKFVGEFK